ncbi:peptide chain release factor N(5)-glutamine methyltransferase [Planctomonas psychrotolerans]|uniref:peptide chain release factor N(5)-glutamine methyltransferase n=1 Tax=Planctomonas psychrotolerans TaxID=2528712 RepID=UPI0012395E80|nr:peptide chain release factor N(5)-glutamine methyltransferase [Planctomonas psychrotolerans]
MPLTVKALRQGAIDDLAAAGVLDPEVDAELLIAHVLGASRGRVQSLGIMDAPVDDADASEVRALVRRRAAREPLQHITGRAPFRSLDLAVGPGVFVPRPETEGVAQIAIDALRAAAAPSPLAVDLGTGSGAIALALATEVPHSRVVAIEKSPDAHAWASRNVAEFASTNVTLLLADLADAPHEYDGCASVVASNPPYIPSAAIPRDPEVRLFDPELALYGGEDGLDVVRAVSVTAARLLHAGGTLVIEHGELQGAEIRQLLLADGWQAAATHRDLTGRDRVTTALRAP